MANVNSAKSARPPRLIYSLLEGRALLEAAMLPMLVPLLNGTPRGDGHPVLLVPGFTAGDATMIGLKTFLRRSRARRRGGSSRRCAPPFPPPPPTR